MHYKINFKKYILYVQIITKVIILIKLYFFRLFNLLIINIYYKFKLLYNYIHINNIIQIK